LLVAATEEFAAYGIAGARVDRVAAAAGVNKAQMYGWFGSKEGLFDAAFAEQLHRIVDVVPFTVDDLPGYAVRLYDSYLAEPDLVRLASWYRLERVQSGDLLAGHPSLTDDKHQAIARAQADGRLVDDLHPEDVYALVIALAGAWSPASVTYTASRADEEADHERRRTALRGVVRRALLAGATTGDRAGRTADGATADDAG
jgi:AcrR family transcriptional regulator